MKIRICFPDALVFPESNNLQNSTTSWQDFWGQTVWVAPETGPWTAYTYDLSGKLTQVDQVNTTGAFASTFMAYDLGGRKLEISDPDMGVWTKLSNLSHLTSLPALFFPRYPLVLPGKQNQNLLKPAISFAPTPPLFARIRMSQ